MKRSIFLLIAAIIGAGLGSLMLFSPEVAAENFGVATTPLVNFMFGTLGGFLISMAFLNFAVRNHADSNTLKMVLLTNIIIHLLSMTDDLRGVSNGVLQFSKIIPAIVIHLFVGIGAAYYVMKIKS